MTLLITGATQQNTKKVIKAHCFSLLWLLKRLSCRTRSYSFSYMFLFQVYTHAGTGVSSFLEFIQWRMRRRIREGSLVAHF